MTKSWGDQYTAGPPNQKVGGDLSPPVPMVVAPMDYIIITSLFTTNINYKNALANYY